MSVVQKTVRSVVVAVSWLFVALSVIGIGGAWWGDHWATGVVRKGFDLLDSAAEVVDSGVARAENLVATSRTEVQQATQTITAAGPKAQANSAVLNALNERLDNSLAPRIAQVQQVLTPVRDAVRTVAAVVSFLNSFPDMAERVPQLQTLDSTFDRIQGLAADTTQLRSTLRALVLARAGEITPETVETLNALAKRIDQRLGEVQASVQGVRVEITALQGRMDRREARLILLFDIIAGLVTLMLAWIVYSQLVVIRHHARSEVSNRGAEVSRGVGV